MYICDVDDILVMDRELRIKHRLLVRLWNHNWYERHGNVVKPLYPDFKPPQEDEVTLLVSSDDGKMVLVIETQTQEQREYVQSALTSIYNSGSPGGS
jgi:hypothetical protein